MSFYGDLKSLHLADLLQNFETHALTGTLYVASSRGENHIYMKRGKLSMLAGTDRAPLMTTLERQGVLTAEQLKNARARRKGSRKSLGEAIVQLKYLTAEDLFQVAQAVLTEDLCDLIATAEGEFKFKDGKIPARIFDPEERRLELGIPVGPLLLESARRSDEWARIRKEIPSDQVFFVPSNGVEPPSELENQDLSRALLEVLDGTCNARDAVDRFGRRRFEAYQVLAQLVKHHCVRSVEADDLVDLAERFAASDPQRARSIIRSGLEASPHHTRLLALQADIASESGDKAEAAEALKMLAHLQIDGDQSSHGRESLDRAKALTPGDPAVWERSLQLALQEGRREDAIHDGLHLVSLHREPGLHTKAKAVLERMVEVFPRDVKVCREYARTIVDLGEPKEAIRILYRAAKASLGREDYTEARAFYQDILELDSSEEEAVRNVEMIDSEAFARRRENRKNFIRRVAAATILVCGVSFSVLEFRARMDYAHANTQVSEQRLIEQRRYRDAMRYYLEVMERHPLTPTAQFDAERRVQELESKAESDPAGRPSSEAQPSQPQGESAEG